MFFTSFIFNAFTIFTSNFDLAVDFIFASIDYFLVYFFLTAYFFFLFATYFTIFFIALLFLSFFLFCILDLNDDDTYRTRYYSGDDVRGWFFRAISFLVSWVNFMLLYFAWRMGITMY